MCELLIQQHSYFVVKHRCWLLHQTAIAVMMIIAQAAVVAMIGSYCGYEGHCGYQT